MVEGPSDEGVLSIWFPEVLRDPRVAVLHGNGGHNARHADQLAAWLAGTDRVGLRRVLYLRDRTTCRPRYLTSSRRRRLSMSLGAANLRTTCWTPQPSLRYSPRSQPAAVRPLQPRTLAWR